MSELFDAYIKKVSKEPIVEEIPIIKTSGKKKKLKGDATEKTDAPETTSTDTPPEETKAPEGGEGLEEKGLEGPSPESSPEEPETLQGTDPEPEKQEEQLSQENDRRTTILAWMKKLNAKFKPMAEFKLIIEQTDDGSEDMFLSLKPQEGKADTHFYHIEMEKELTDEVFNGIMSLAEKQLSELSAVNESVVDSAKKINTADIQYVETLSVRAVNGWEKIKTKDSLAMFKKDKMIIEVVSEKRPGTLKYVMGYTVSMYEDSMLKRKYISTQKSITNIAELKSATFKLMNQNPQ